jgi:2-C-methyl-D-erythritol 4-phosphate cytidylyltransferase
MEMKTVVIVLAGGDGKRFGMAKQFVSVYNIPIFIYTLKAFKDFPRVITIPNQFKDIVLNNIESYNKNKDLTNVYVTKGGQTRQESVYNALTYIKQHFKNCENVIITDANRPCITQETIDKCLVALRTNKAVLTVCKSINTSCLSKYGNILDKILDRNFQYDLLMPQCFKFKELYETHSHTTYTDASDDFQILQQGCPSIKAKLISISFWEGLKLTYPSDYKIFETLLRKDKK